MKNITGQKTDCRQPPKGYVSSTLQPLREFAGRSAALARCLCLLLGALPFTARPDTVVVFNEIMYHPATNEAALEWVELYNQMSVNVDLTGWRLSGGIDYTFANNTVIKAGGHLVVATSPATLMAQTVLTNVLGPFTGRLSNTGETLNLRDNVNRLMDSVTYGTDGTWPVGPDGAGVSLAKKSPNLASKPPENWTASLQIGGTPGTTNFTSTPVYTVTANIVPITAAWKYDESGTDLGTVWRTSGYNDAAWSSGAALFHTGNAALPAAKNTPFTTRRSTYYFRTEFNVSGDPAQAQFSFRPIVDDGAVFYLNGAEIYRLNMPAGAVNYFTAATSAVSQATWSGPFSIPSGNLVVGRNVLAVELHQATPTTNSSLRWTPASGAYTIAWDGGDGDFSTPSSPTLAPTNAASPTLGTEVLVTSNTNQASSLIDGVYGSSSSWSPDPTNTSPSAVLRFNRVIPLSSIAWGRDNGNTNEAACGGTCTDRAIGTCTIQYTMVATPSLSTGSASNPSNGWVNLATVQYYSTQPGFTPSLRHRFDFAATNGNPILATGVRFRPAVSNTIDEIEINPPPPPATNFNAAFGMEINSSETVAPLTGLAFNEVSAITNAGFWLELINASTAALDLTGVQIMRSGDGSPTYTFPAQSLPPGGIVSLTQEQLGFGATNDCKLFLFSRGQFFLLDALTVQSSPRGRHPDGSGAWMCPAQPTPGASNVFVFHNEIVFNELMYHHRPFDATPAVTSNSTVVLITNTWRYNDSGTDLGTLWRAAGYNDTAWPTGAALMYFNTGSLPAPTNTAFTPGRTTYYFRTSFNFSGSTTNLALNLRTVVDDGAVFYLNGVEIYRQNMPLGSVVYSTSATSPIGDAGFIGPVTLPANNLVQGANVLAVEVHQITSATTSSGLVLSGGGLTLVDEGPFGGSPPINLARQAGSAPFAKDSLVGYPYHQFVGLTDGNYGNNAGSWIGNTTANFCGVRFGGLSTISSFAFGRDNTGVLTDRTFGLYTLAYTRVATPSETTPVTGNPDTGWVTIGTLNYQNPGTGLFTLPSRRHRYSFTPVNATGIRLAVPDETCIDELEVNPPDTTGDIAFGAELALSTTNVPATPFTKSDEEWVELYNRSTNTVDLTGWRIDGGIHYDFSNGTVISPGGYLVVANDATALKTKWPEVSASILGNFSGKLSADATATLKDALDNPVNAIRICANGWSDGGGSSLELTDPRADNSNPNAWADSNESTRSAWQTVTYRMTAGQTFGATFWNEYRLGQLDPGEVLVDDVSVIRDPDGTRQQLIQNGNFETTSGNTHWRMLGDHGNSQIITDPDNAANHVLKVSASAPPRTSHNHIESSFVGNTAVVDGQTYEVSYRARWLVGSPQVNTCAYMQRLAKTTILNLPCRHGTPGVVNSRRVANAGPTFTDLKHSPVIPQSSEAVTISVRASDPDGVSSATLKYRVNPAATFTSAPMTLQSNGAWTANIPAQVAGAIVQFYVTAQDSFGASAYAPPKGPDSRALYQVADAQGAALPTHELRLIQLDADRDFVLNATNVMSQALIGGTVIYDRIEVFYDAGVRLHGSAAGRARDGDDYISYTIAFPPDHLFRGLQTEVNIDRSGRSPIVRQQDEIYILHMFHRAGLTCHYSDLCYFIAPKALHTGTALLQLSVYGGIYVQEQYPVNGTVFNYDITYEPSTTVDATFEGIKLPVPLQAHLGTDFADLGNDKEEYREPFDMRHGTREDDCAGLIRLCQTMALPQAQFDSQIAAALDVDEALRIAALTVLCGIGDIYFGPSGNLPHNLRLFTPLDGGPAHFLPWDMDFVFNQATSSSIYPGSDKNFSKLMNNPATLRAYLSHLSDLCQTVFTSDYMIPWLAHYGSVVGQNYSGGSSYIDARRAYVLSQLPAPPPFAVTNNGGNNFTVTNGVAVLSGTAPLSVGQIEVNGVVYPVAWSSISNWTITIPLASGANTLVVQGLSAGGSVASNANANIVVTNTGASAFLPVVINEWMADNKGPAGFADPADGLFQDWFELFNPNTNAVNLSGLFLTDTLSNPTKWQIPANVFISAHGFLLVWADNNTNQNPVAGGTNEDLHACFQLNNSGEAIGLFALDGVTPISTVSFANQMENVSQGWFPDGDTNTLYFMTNSTPRAPNEWPALQVAGQVELESYAGVARDGRGTRLVTFKATDDAGHVLRRWDQTLNFTPGANGAGTAGFTLTKVPAATTRLSAKTAWTLRKRLTVTFSNALATAAFTSNNRLPGGDLDNSNQVDFADFNQMAAFWYTSDAASDINGDGLVDIEDYFILASRWYLQGDPE